MNTVTEALKAFSPQLKLSSQQYRTVDALLKCRTAELGGHAQKCDHCDRTRVYYNSCRNRHCPQCRGLNNAIWIDRMSSNVLDAPYFHLVFTVPEQLHALIYANKKSLYPLFYKAASETILELCSDQKYLGAQTGFFSILHTWSQDLRYHPHLHTVVLGGGLTEHGLWRSSKKKYFIPVKVLSKKFRGKFLYYLKKFCAENPLLVFFPDCCRKEKFNGLISQLYLVNWYVYAKENFAGPQAVLKYLGHYTGRVAIANSRVVAVTNKQVSFMVRDRKNADRKKVITLNGKEFARRFLLHVLPKGFVKIRYYGIMATRNKNTKLVRCRRLTNSSIFKPRFTGLSKFEVACILAGQDLRRCPVCGKGQLKNKEQLAPEKET